MPVPEIAIVGRPNVGKSTLLNALVGRRVSIVDATAGTTRDRVTARVVVGRRAFDAVDTGGIGIVDERDLALHVEAQIAIAIERATKIAFVVDAAEGVTPLDVEVARRLRRSKRTVVLVANKCEGKQARANLAELHSLGFGEPIPISAISGQGISGLADELANGLAKAEPEGDPELRIAIVGKRNAGKSTFVNALAREERVIVNELAGTTRDAVDVAFEHAGRRFVAIDTAGLRRRKSISQSVEFFSMKRAEAAIDRADAVLLVYDCSTELSIVDKDLARACVERAKPTVVVANKWDLAEAKGLTLESYRRYLAERLPNFSFAPVVATSAKDGERVFAAVDLAIDLHGQGGVRVSTADLNRVLEAAIDKQMPGRGMIAKVFYGTQVAVHPPTFVLFVNEPKAFPPAYERYLHNRFREAFEFREIPIKIRLRKRERVELPPREQQVGRARMLPSKGKHVR
ncbi:MAG TPA: ribosome biogenesis GTPase Der [Planctomycetota bacterium]|nr:ribosome biogenesis GTPase Der [Planctomycetota bacterium]